MLITIYFSFTSAYSGDIWTFLIIIKIIMIFLEYFDDLIMQEKILVNPLSACMGVTQNLITLGADDFLVFLKSYFISLGLFFY